MRHPGHGLKAVVFDLDGTLVDTTDDFIPAVLQLQDECGRAALPASRIRSSVSNGSRALVKLALTIEEDDPEFERHRERLLQLYAEVLGRFSKLYPGLGELLRELEARGIRWGIATNKPRAYTDPLLSTLGIHASSVVCPEDVAITKPDPECLHIACRELECETAEIIYVGDHARDIEAGQRAGSFTIAAAYGYIEPGDCAERWGADAIAGHSNALQDLIFNTVNKVAL
jgi:phosphoglycolate phosphatase